MRETFPICNCFYPATERQRACRLHLRGGPIEGSLAFHGGEQSGNADAPIHALRAATRRLAQNASATRPPALPAPPVPDAPQAPLPPPPSPPLPPSLLAHIRGAMPGAAAALQALLRRFTAAFGRQPSLRFVLT